MWLDVESKKNFEIVANVLTNPIKKLLAIKLIEANLICLRLQFF